MLREEETDERELINDMQEIMNNIRDIVEEIGNNVIATNDRIDRLFNLINDRLPEG